MSQVFRKVTNLYQPLLLKCQKGKGVKLAKNSVEPSEQTTYGKTLPKLKNEIQKEQQLNINNNTGKENMNKLSKKEISEFPKFDDIKKEEEKKTSNIQKNPEKLRKNEKYYLSREIALTIEKYGRELFACVKNNEPRFLLPLNFMDKHTLSPEARERMVDWMVEIFSVYKCDPGTFELAVHIMDCYISRTKKKLKDEDIHLIGLTCIYISSKVEDIAPLRMSHIVNNLGHKTFNQKTIINKEREIIKTIDFDLFTAGTYDYIMTFFFDLKVNNAKKISELNAVKIVEKYMNFSIFLSQLILYNCEFVCFRQSLNALAILALAFDILKTNIKDLNADLKNFLSDWVFYVINEMGFNSDAIKIIYLKIYDLYSEKVILPQSLKDKNKRKENEEIEIINLCTFNQDKFI